MLEVADILRLHGAAYRARFGKALGPGHLRALRDLEACRTPACRLSGFSARSAWNSRAASRYSFRAGAILPCRA